MAWRDFIYWLTIKPRLNCLREILPEAKIYPCGSRYICNPPPLTTDVDFLVYVETDIDLRLQSHGYQKSMFNSYSRSYDVDNFTAYRKGPVNLIVTQMKGYAGDFLLGTAICKRFNVRDKFYRVFVHEYLRNDGAIPAHWNYFIERPALLHLLESLKGPHQNTTRELYRIQHNVPKV